MLFYRQYQFEGVRSHPFGEVFTRMCAALDACGLDDSRIGFMFSDRPGTPAGCPRILERFPELEEFSIRHQAGPYGAVAARITNLDSRWDGAAREAPGEVARATLAAIAQGIPSDYPVEMATIVVGPVRWNEAVEPRETAMRTPRAGAAPFSSRLPIMTYLAPCVILQRGGSGLIVMWAVEQLADRRGKIAMPPGIQRLAQQFGRPKAGAVVSAQEREARATVPMNSQVAAIHARHRENLARVVAGLALPHRIPDARETIAMRREPLGQVRTAIAKVFAPEGWKRATGRIPAGTNQLWKSTLGGRQIVLNFDTGSWSRHVTCTMSLETERGALRMPVPADGLGRTQYLATNREVFGQILDNIRVVASHLENTWVRDVEAAMGPTPSGYEPPPM